MDNRDYKEEIRGLPRRHQVAFLAAICERLLPNFEAFAREAMVLEQVRVLRTALDVVWRRALAEEVGTATLKELAEECYRIAPETEDWESDFTSAALDAANAVAAALLFCKDRDPARVEEILTYSYDTLYVWLQIRSDLNPDDPNFNAQVSQHPLTVRELTEQQADYAILSSATAIDSAVRAALIRGTRGSLEA